MNFHDLQIEILLAVLGLVVLVLEAIRPIQCVRGLGIGLAALVGGLFYHSLSLQPEAAPILGGLYKLDGFAIFFQRLFLAITALVLLIGAEFSHRNRAGAAEFYVVTLFASVGMMFCAAVDDFILLFVALELMTVAFYVLVGYLRHDGLALESAMKYLLFGALASGVMVYGIAYVFGTTGSTKFDAIAAAIAGATGEHKALEFGMLLTLAGLFFKISAFPAQMWTPDVYQGAPTPTTAYLATGSKAAGFALLMRVLYTAFEPAQNLWVMLVVVLAGISLLYGNLGAIAQTNLKRLFGYSSIAHAGYLLIGIAACSTIGIAAVMFYLAQYAFTNLCAFLAIVAISNATESADISAVNGLHKRSPLLAAALALPMLSLAGVPPLSGFFGKFMLFYAAIDRGLQTPAMIVLVAVACVGVVVSLYYYFKVIRAAYFEDAPDAAPIHVPDTMRIAILACLAILLILGVYPRPLWQVAELAAKALGLP